MPAVVVIGGFLTILVSGYNQDVNQLCLGPDPPLTGPECLQDPVPWIIDQGQTAILGTCLTITGAVLLYLYRILRRVP